MTGCGCHDVAVFGHQEGCALGAGPPGKSYRDWKTELADRALSHRLEELSARGILKGRTMPRGNNAVNGGWLKKRG